MVTLLCRRLPGSAVLDMEGGVAQMQSRFRVRADLCAPEIRSAEVY